MLNYEAFVLDGVGDDYSPEFHGGGGDTRIPGSDSFVDRCLSHDSKKTLHLTAQDIIDKVCEAYSIDELILKTQSQQRVASEARAVVGLLANEVGGVTLSDVASHVNHEAGSVSSSVKRLLKRMQELPELTDRVRVLKAVLERQVANLSAIRV